MLIFQSENFSHSLLEKHTHTHKYKKDLSAHSNQAENKNLIRKYTFYENDKWLD